MAADRPRRAKPILLAGTAFVALAVMGIGWVAWPRGTTAISHDAALKEFRRGHPVGDAADSPDADSSDVGSSNTSTTGADNESDRLSTPETGVYTYTAEGNERVKLGPFPAEERPLPGTISVVVSAPRADTDSGGLADNARNAVHGTSCFDWTLNVFAEHTEVTTWCVEDTGTLRMTAHAKHQSIGALSPTATLDCAPDILIDPGTSESDLECELRLEGGLAAITARITGTATVSPTEQVTLGKFGSDDTTPDSTTSDNTSPSSTEVVETTLLEITYIVSGDLSGTWSEKLWLSEDMLPVRIVRNLELSGPATFTEHSTFELSRLSPTR